MVQFLKDKWYTMNNISEARSTLMSMYCEGRGVTDQNYPDIAAIALLPKEVKNQDIS